MQKKPNDTPFIWGEYEALQDPLTMVFNNTTEDIETEVQNIPLELTDTDTSVHAIQTQVTDIQTSIQVLRQSINALCLAVERQSPPLADADDNDESVHDDNEGIAATGRGNGHGNGHPVCGHGFVPLGIQRVPIQ
jgi:hypothetical protein